MLSELESLIVEVKPYLDATIPAAQLSLGRSTHNFASDFRRPDAWISEDKLYCPACTKDRRVRIEVHVHNGPLTRLSRSKPRTTQQTFDTSEWGPSLLVFTCEQCALKLNCLIYDEIIDSGCHTKVVIFPSKAGGLSTPNTPKEVKHFVDEAYKCQCVSAYGAAIEMYRAALEQMLHEEGYQQKLLHAKIEALEAHRVAGTGKPWVADLDTEMLHVLRKLGNQVAHPKDSATLIALNADTVVGVQEVFQYLLADVYERPKEQEELISSLQQMRRDTGGE